MKLLHTMIRVKDIDASLRFYEGLFGLKVAKEMRLEDCKLYFLADGFGEVQIELTQNDETPEEGYEIGTGFGHFAFEIEDYKEFGEKMSELGYEYLYEPFKLDNYGLTIAFLKDPDGYEIELVQGS